MDSSLWYNTADQIGNDDIIARDFEFHTIIDIYAHAGKTLCRCENGWYIELEDSAKVLFQWANGQRYVYAPFANYFMPKERKMKPCNIDITKTPNNEYEVRATFGKWSIGSNICYQRESDAILNLSKDIDKIVVRLFHTLHEWGDEYLKNKWDELNRNA